MEMLSLKENKIKMARYFGRPLYVDVYDTRLKKVIEHYGNLIAVYDTGIIINEDGNEINLSYIAVGQTIMDIKENSCSVEAIYEGYKPCNDNSNLEDPYEVALAYHKVFGVESAKAYLAYSHILNKKILESINSKKAKKSPVTDLSKLRSDLVGKIFKLEIYEDENLCLSYHQISDVDINGVTLSNGTIKPFMNISKRINSISTTNPGDQPLYAINESTRMIMKERVLSEESIYLGYFYQFGYDVAVQKMDSDYARYRDCLDKDIAGQQPLRSLQTSVPVV